jgi:hypothetical protein
MLRPALALLCASLLSLSAQEMPKPTPHHEAMKAQAGTWDAVVKMGMGPGKPPMEMKGVEVNTLLLGGLWLASEFKADMGGAPFEGRGLFGYDTQTKRHVGTWVDNSATWQAVTSGTCKDGCRELVSFFQGYTPEGKPASYKEVFRQPDADHRRMEMYTKGAKGWNLILEIDYTRRK